MPGRVSLTVLLVPTSPLKRQVIAEVGVRDQRLVLVGLVVGAAPVEAGDELVEVLVGVLVLFQFAVAFVQSLETSVDSEVGLTVFFVVYFVLPEQFLDFLSLEDLFVVARALLQICRVIFDVECTLE